MNSCNTIEILNMRAQVDNYIVQKTNLYSKKVDTPTNKVHQGVANALNISVLEIAKDIFLGESTPKSTTIEMSETAKEVAQIMNCSILEIAKDLFGSKRV